MERSQFSEARAKATAQRIRDGIPAEPMFKSDIKAPGKGGVHIITNIGKPTHA